MLSRTKLVKSQAFGGGLRLTLHTTLENKTHRSATLLRRWWLISSSHTQLSLAFMCSIRSQHGWSLLSEGIYALLYSLVAFATALYLSTPLLSKRDLSTQERFKSEQKLPVKNAKMERRHGEIQPRSKSTE